MKKIIYILFLYTTLGFAQADALFKKANNLYNVENYEQAIATYQQLLSTNVHSAEVYFNKANAHYKLNQLAESIYNYEKALQLNPSSKKIKINLSYANNQKIDKIDVIPTTGISKIANTIVNVFKFDVWAIISIVFIFIFIIAFIGYLYTRFKRFYFSVGLLGLLLSILSILFAFKQENNVINTTYAIVFAKQTEVKTDPKLSSEKIFVLHEGTKVKIIAYFENWNKIKIDNGSEGWIRASDIKKL